MNHRQLLSMMLLCVFMTGAVAVKAELVRIVINPKKTAGPISPYIFGAGIDAKTNPMRFCRYPEQVANYTAASGLRMARYPGGFVFARDDHRGSWKNFYWQDHIGQNPDRKPFYMYDLDTFVQFCERFAIEPLMQINFVGETQQSVLDYIEYLVGRGDLDGNGVDWAAVRAQNGRTAPYNIKYWQLGNEVHSYPQGFQENAQGAKEYAERLNQLVPVIRRLVPNARIVVPFINIERPISGMKPAAEDMDINFATSSEFARAFLQHLHVDIDYMDWHFYGANGWNGNYPFLGSDDEWKHYYCWGTKFRECYDVVVDLLKEHYQCRPLPRIIVGEWSGDFTGSIFHHQDISYRGSMMRTMASAVYMADILLFMQEKSTPSERLHAACWHNFANGAQELFSIQTTEEYTRMLGAGQTWKGNITDEGYGFRMPVYWVFKMLSEQRGQILVDSRVEVGNNRINAPHNGLYWDPQYHFSWITHSVTRAGGKLYLAVVNKDAHRQADLHITIKNWSLGPTMVVYTVGADSYLAENTMQQPDHIIMTGPKTRHCDDPTNIHIALPANTVMVLRFEKAANSPPNARRNNPPVIVR